LSSWTICGPQLELSSMEDHFPIMLVGA
jgi:hypothetical protein